MPAPDLSTVATLPHRPEPPAAPDPAVLRAAQAAAGAAALREALMRAMVFAVFAAAGLGLLWFGCAMVMARAVTVLQSLAFTLPGGALLLAGAAVAMSGRAALAAPAFGPMGVAR